MNCLLAGCEGSGRGCVALWFLNFKTSREFFLLGTLQSADMKDE